MRQPARMNWTRHTAIVFAGVVAAAPAFAAEPAADPGPALAPVGSWTRYHVEIKTSDGRGWSCKYTLAMVGNAIHEDEACRWIEMRMHGSSREDDRTPEIHSVLVRERDLLESPLPFQKVVKCRYRIADDEIVERDSDSYRNFGSFVLCFPGVLKDCRKLDEPRRVQYQSGNLDIESGLGGRHVQEFAEDPGSSIRAEFSVWLHPDVPLGYAYAKIKNTNIRDGAVLDFSSEMEHFLEETGTDAKPSF